ncbi:MAG TPA: NADH-quinone oxidoreductase subunit C, partial [Anaeromyxobacteraceae bacterium]|nr:NADH-quinone oxidoreductase subunit C [Anaeromyxobacteraceae bacterium]
MTPVLTIPVRDLASEPDELFEALSARLSAGARVLTLWGQPAADPAELTLTAVVADGPKLEVLRADVAREPGFRSLTREFPALHAFEREIFEQHGVRPLGHPWLKPIRFPGAKKGAIEAYPFYPIDGQEVHEVAVGPIHAGVIEPGHFRFMCFGETVQFLEVQLGWQHRGAERLLLARDPLRLTPLVETISGDTSVAHAWAHAAALEALAGAAPDAALDASRALGLELERIAMHLAGLSGLATDIAFLQGSSSYGRLRTTAINTTQLVCGNRFGRGWVRPGATRAGWDAQKLAAVR